MMADDPARRERRVTHLRRTPLLRRGAPPELSGREKLKLFFMGPSLLE